MGVDVVFAKTTEETDGGRSGVEVSKLMLLNGLPVTGWGRVDGGGFEDSSSDTVEKRTVDDITDRTCEIGGCADCKTRNVRVTGNPANISHAGEPVLGMDIEGVFEGHGCSKEVTCSGVDNTFRFTSGSRGLKGSRFAVRDSC